MKLMIEICQIKFAFLSGNLNNFKITFVFRMLILGNIFIMCKFLKKHHGNFGFPVVTVVLFYFILF